ncbi:hypothetical protein RB195_013489 [Necator americanus]|uniref:Uncharacterized protein n=1 Tax=Necator americanus TaxID=51031 RepID=A0ABR1DVS8_NECAM
MVTHTVPFTTSTATKEGWKSKPKLNLKCAIPNQRSKTLISPSQSLRQNRKQLHLRTDQETRSMIDELRFLFMYSL